MKYKFQNAPTEEKVNFPCCCLNVVSFVATSNGAHSFLFEKDGKSLSSLSINFHFILHHIQERHGVTPPVKRVLNHARPLPHSCDSCALGKKLFGNLII